MLFYNEEPSVSRLFQPMQWEIPVIEEPALVPDLTHLDFLSYTYKRKYTNIYRLDHTEEFKNERSAKTKRISPKTVKSVQNKLINSLEYCQWTNGANFDYYQLIFLNHCCRIFN